LELSARREKQNFINLHKKYEDLIKKLEKSELEKSKLQEDIDTISKRI